jgi:hypothetical protein
MCRKPFRGPTGTKVDPIDLGISAFRQAMQAAFSYSHQCHDMRLPTGVRCHFIALGRVRFLSIRAEKQSLSRGLRPPRFPERAL